MKFWIKTTVLTITFLSSLTFVKAQVPDITPNNITTVVNEIFALHGNQITIDYDSLYQFIDDLLPASNDPNYDPLTPSPSANLDDVTSDSIYHSWNSVSNASSYQASFINLNPLNNQNIEKGSMITTNTSSSFGVSNGLVLAVFQTKRSRLQVGRGNVVIVDKPVFFEQINEDCSCAIEGPSSSENFGGPSIDNNNSVSFDYTHNGPVGYYSTTVVNSDGSVATVLFKVEILEDGTTIIGKVCSEGIDNDPGESFMYVKGARPQKVSGTLTFSGGISFHPYGEAIGTVTVTECFTEERDDDGEPRLSYNAVAKDGEIIVAPNPARYYVDIFISQADWNEKRNCFLMDPTGKQLAVPAGQLEEYNGKLRLDIRSLPLGSYVFVVQQKHEVIKTRFLKLE